MVLAMTLNDKIEILDNTLRMLSALYEEYNMKKFLSMSYCLEYDKTIITDSLIDTVESLVNLNY